MKKCLPWEKITQEMDPRGARLNCEWGQVKEGKYTCVRCKSGFTSRRDYDGICQPELIKGCMIATMIEERLVCIACDSQAGYFAMSGRSRCGKVSVGGE